MAIDINIVEWLKNWFVDKGSETRNLSEVVSDLTTSINGKVSVNQGNANASKNVVTDSGGSIVTQSIDSTPTQNSDNMVKSSGIYTALNGKVDKVTGKGLSTEDYTTTEKNKLSGIETEANKYVHPTGIGSAQTSTALKKIKYDAQGHITGTENVNGSDLPTHTHITNQIAEMTSLSNIGTSSGATQLQVNNAIDIAIGNLQSIKAIEVVSSLPTASPDTMNRLYVVSENSKINVYYTEQSGSTYSWHKMDADILDELSIDWSEIENNPFSSASPSDYATSTHVHGNLQNDGQVGTSNNASKNVVTDSNGKITTENKPTIPTNTSDLTNDGADGTNVFVANNDSRLTNARTPTSHTHGNITNDGKIGSDANKVLITTTNGVISTREVDELNCGTFTELQDLIDDANYGDTIVLSKDYKYDSNVDTNISQEYGIEITESITIIGNGHVIDGNEEVHLFTVIHYDVIFIDINLINGDGGITVNENASNGNLTIENCLFYNNYYVDYQGGAINSYYANLLTVKNSTFINNRSTNNGGAIYCKNNSKILDCVFLHNVSQTNEGDVASTQTGLVIYNCTTSNDKLYNTTNKPYLTDHQDISGKQNTLVSGTNIKTINNQSLLGSGNISVGSSVTKTSDLTNDGEDGSNPFVSDDDSRLSDARTPTSHTHGQITNDGKITSSAVTVASDDNIVVTDTSDSSKVKRVANLLASQIKDANAHVSGIGSAINDTQATINTKIDTELANLDEKLAERKVFYVDQSDLPSGTSDWGYEEIYIVYYTDYTSSPYQSEWRIYYWADGTFSTDLSYISLSKKGDCITSISLIPYSTDSSGKIRLYFGDES